MQCKYIKQNGQRCRANSINGSEFCFFHSPEISAEKRKEASSRGGKKNTHRVSTPLKPVSFNKTGDVSKVLAETINLVRSGQIEVNIAKCIGYLSGQLLKAMEVSELENRIEKLEEIVLKGGYNGGNKGKN